MNIWSCVLELFVSPPIIPEENFKTYMLRALFQNIHTHMQILLDMSITIQYHDALLVEKETKY